MKKVETEKEQNDEVLRKMNEEKNWEFTSFFLKYMMHLFITNEK